MARMRAPGKKLMVEMSMPKVLLGRMLMHATKILISQRPWQNGAAFSDLPCAGGMSTSFFLHLLPFHRV